MRASDIEAQLTQDPSITHVALVHCETSTGILNPLTEIAAVVARHGRGLIVDAMSTFARAGDRRAHDAVRCAHRGLRQVPRGCPRDRFRAGAPFGARALRGREPFAGHGPVRPVDLHDPNDPVALSRRRRTSSRRSMRRSRSTSRRAGSRLAAPATRPTAANCSRACADSACAPSCRPPSRRPIIVTVHAPQDPRYEFKRFYQAVKERGFILYPGKLTTVETFRVGCMGQLGASGVRGRGNRDRRRTGEPRDQGPATATTERLITRPRSARGCGLQECVPWATVERRSSPASEESTTVLMSMHAGSVAPR